MSIVNKLKLFVASLVAVSGLLAVAVPQQTSALFEAAKQDACQGATLGSSSDCTSGADEKLSGTINTVINTLSVIIGIVAVVMIIMAGFRYITAAGDTNNIGSAKNTLIYAIVGLIVVALAQTIVKFVLSRV